MHVQVSHWDVVGGKVFGKFGARMDVIEDGGCSEFFMLLETRKGRSEIHQVGKALTTQHQERRGRETLA